MFNLKKIKYLSIFFLIIFPLTVILSCKNIQMRIDRYGLKKNTDILLLELQNQQVKGTQFSFRTEIENYIKNYSLQKIKENVQKSHTLASIRIMNTKKKWNVKIFKKQTIVPNIYTFSLNHPMQKKTGPAYFYLWQVSPIKNNKSLIWIPGMGVSDFAFCFIDKLIIAALEKGYNVALYVPPMHLERIANEKEPGEGFFTADIKHNFSMIDLTVSEIYTIGLFLKQNQSTTISGWGGSIGATILLLAGQLMQFEQLTIMIPVLDMNDLLVNNDSMRKVVEFYSLLKFDKPFLQTVYQKINPIHYPLPVTKENILIQYGIYDQLVSPQTVLSFAEKFQIKNVIGYKRSHATILINDKLFKDYRLFQK